MKAVILAAGFGMRLQEPLPKPMTRVLDSARIIDVQIERLRRHLPIHDVCMVVGFKKEALMEAYPDVTYVYNERFAQENTCGSLLRAIARLDDDVLQLNGDVVFNDRVLDRLLACPSSAMLVTRGPVADEEVKYVVDAEGYIGAVSKQIDPAVAEGEAIGINLFRRADLPRLLDGLGRASRRDYFEAGVELAIREGMRLRPVVADVSECVEVDFPGDLERARGVLRAT